MKKDDIYTIKEIVVDGLGVTLDEVHIPNIVGFLSSRFRPLIDESFGERICAEITEQVKSEELVYD